MTRVLHTADVHLAADHLERLEALEAVLDRAVNEDVDLLTIGGDLFDSEVDADELRPDLRDRFAGLPFEVLTIPGNHDADAFGEDLFFGEDFQAAVGEPFEHHQVGDDLRVTCLPYTPQPTEDLLVALAEREPFDGAEALLLHCSLEAPFADTTVGEEATQRYFPIEKATLAELGFDYYLSGHYHAPHRVELPNGATFVYPGTPASVTRSETGPRAVALLDTASHSVELTSLETFHYDHREFEVVPGAEGETIEAVEAWAAERADRDVEATVTVVGHLDTDEAAFEADLEAASGAIPVENRTRSVSDVLTNPLFQSFADRLEAREYDDETLRDAIDHRTIRVFSELDRRGRFR